MFKNLQPSERTLQLGFLVAIIVLISTSILSIWGTQRLISDVGWIDHTQQVLTNLRVLGSTLDVLEAAPSRYTAQERADLLQTYETDAQIVSASLEQLNSLTVDNAAQHHRLAILQPLVNNELAIVESSFQSASTPAIAAVMLSQSVNLPRLDVAISQTLHDMRDEEQSLLNVRSDKSTVSAQVATGLSFAGALGSSLILFICGVQLERTNAVQKQVAVSLAENEQRARTQYKSLPMPTYTWRKVGDDLILVDYNDKAAQITQGRIAALLGASATVRYANEPEMLDKFWQCYNSQQILTWETYFESTLSGHGQYLVLTCVYVAPDLVMVHTLDETERKRAEAERRDSQLFSIRIAESSPNVIYIYDLGKERTTYWNRELGSELGYTPAEIQAIGPSFVSKMMHPDDWAGYSQYVAEIATLADSSTSQTTFRMRARDGGWSWFNLRAVVFSRRPDGSVRE